MNFNEKFDEAMARIDLLLNNDYTPKNIKKYIEAFKLENSIEARNKRKIGESFLNQSINSSYILDDKRQRQTIMNEIRETQNRFNGTRSRNIINRPNSKRTMIQDDDLLNNSNNIGKKIRVFSPINSKEETNNLFFSSNLDSNEYSKLLTKLNIEKIEQRNKQRTMELDVNNLNNINNIELKKKRLFSSNGITQRDRIDNLNYKQMLLSESNYKFKNYSLKPKQKIIKTFERKKENRYNIDIRTPLSVRPNYLRQKFNNSKKNKLYENRYRVNSSSPYNSRLNDLRYQMNNYNINKINEGKINKLKNNNNLENDISDLLNNSITTKYALLNKIQRDIDINNEKIQNLNK